jgi:hypothetical protein
MKSPLELQSQMIHPQQWHLAPKPVCEIAEECAKEGVFTGVAWDEYFGWVILQMDDNYKNQRIAWTERNYPHQPTIDILDEDDEDFLF